MAGISHMIANIYYKMAVAAAVLLGCANKREQHTRTKDKKHNKHNEHGMRRVLTQRKSTRTLTTRLQLHAGRFTITTR